MCAKLTYAEFAGGVEEEDGEVNALEDEACAVNGDDEDAIRVDDRQAVEHPKHAVEECCKVRDGGELLHCFLFPYFDECRATTLFHHFCMIS